MTSARSHDCGTTPVPSNESNASHPSGIPNKTSDVASAPGNYAGLANRRGFLLSTIASVASASAIPTPALALAIHEPDAEATRLGEEFAALFREWIAVHFEARWRGRESFNKAKELAGFVEGKIPTHEQCTRHIEYWAKLSAENGNDDYCKRDEEITNSMDPIARRIMELPPSPAAIRAKALVALCGNSDLLDEKDDDYENWDVRTARSLIEGAASDEQFRELVEMLKAANRDAQWRQIDEFEAPDPILAVIEQHRELSTTVDRLLDKIAEIEDSCSKGGDERPIALINWRGHCIGGPEIDGLRKRLLREPAANRKKIGGEYRKAKAAYQANVRAQAEWDKRHGTKPLDIECRRLCRQQLPQLQKQLSSVRPTTTAGAGALVAYVRAEIKRTHYIDEDNAWELAVLENAAAALRDETAERASATGDVPLVMPRLTGPRRRAPWKSLYELYPLPFFNRDRRCMWDVTPTGDYGEDCNTGEHYAIEFLQTCDGTNGWSVLLRGIVIDMISQGPAARLPNGEPTAGGLVVGFMGVMGRALNAWVWQQKRPAA